MADKQTKVETAKKLARHYFRDDYNRPFEMTDGQARIFNAILLKEYPRTQIIASTQYGKSTVVAMAIILRSITFREDFAVIAGRKEKAQIIMEKVIQHIFDYKGFVSQLDIDPNEPLERLRRERSKDRITWRRGGGVRTFSAGTSNQKAVIDSLTGFGSPNIVEDESALIPDDFQAMIMRMLGGHANNFIMKIGNPFTRGHFLRTWEGDKYHKVFIDYKQAMQEKRYSEDFIEEMRDEPYFDVLYECKFPKDTEMVNGYRKLLANEYFDNAEIESEPEIVEGDTPILGVDIAEGGSAQSTYVLRYPKSNFAKVLEKNNEADLMVQVQKIIKYKEQFRIKDYYVAVDDVGVGAGVTDACREKDIWVSAVKEGESAEDKERYANKKAELYWNAARWIKGGGKIMKDAGFREGENIYYKENTSSKLQMEPKADLAKRGIASPDTWDAFSLTFINTNNIIEEDDFSII